MKLGASTQWYFPQNHLLTFCSFLKSSYFITFSEFFLLTSGGFFLIMCIFFIPTLDRTSQLCLKLCEYLLPFACFEIVLVPSFQKCFGGDGEQLFSLPPTTVPSLPQLLFLADYVLGCLLASCGEAAPCFWPSLLTISGLFQVVNISAFRDRERPVLHTTLVDLGTLSACTVAEGNSVFSSLFHSW